MPGDRRTLRERLLHNLGLKLVSLVAAIVLFSLARGAEDAQRSVFVGVTTMEPSPASPKMLISEIPLQLRLTLRGSRSQLNAVRPENMGVTIDLTDTNLRYYYFADDDFNVPAGVSITQVAPASIPLTWATRVQRTLPIQPQLSGAPPEGLILGAPPRVIPSEVEITGPESEIGELRAILTEPIALEDLALGPATRLVPLIPPTPHSRLPDVPVRVTVDVVRDLTQRTLSELSVEVEGDAELVSRQVRVTAVVRGAPAIIDSIDPAELTAVAEVDSGVRATGSVTVALTTLRGLPREVDVLEIEPAEVAVTFPAD